MLENRQYHPVVLFDLFVQVCYLASAWDDVFWVVEFVAMSIKTLEVSLEYAFEVFGVDVGPGSPDVRNYFLMRYFRFVRVNLYFILRQIHEEVVDPKSLRLHVVNHILVVPCRKVLSVHISSLRT